MNDRNQSRDDLRRLQAKVDFAAMGHKRSVDGLWKDYVVRGKAGEDVPTRNRTQIYQWAKEDDWERYAREQITGTIEEQQKLLKEQRQRAYRSIALLTDKATDRLLKLIEVGDEKVALNAIVEVFDRTGVVKFDKKAGAIDESIRPHSSGPPEDASDEVIQKWLADRAKGISNG